MSKKYEESFKRQLVDRVIGGESMKDVAADAGVSYSALNVWCNKATGGAYKMANRACPMCGATPAHQKYKPSYKHHDPTPHQAEDVVDYYFEGIEENGNRYIMGNIPYITDLGSAIKEAKKMVKFSRFKKVEIFKLVRKTVEVIEK